MALDWHRDRKILLTSERLQPENHHANLVTHLSGGSELINFMSSNSIIFTLLRILPTLIITLLGTLNDLLIMVYDLISNLK